MKLTFLGATHEVTGSCYYLEACGKKILIDCGMEQGRDMFENQEIPVPVGEIDMVLLTHAHIDHSGKLPLLAKNGFGGTIYSTEGTALLCSIMLMDSAHIQEFECEWKNRKAQRAGRPLVEPLYDTNDAQAAIKLFKGLPYNAKEELAPGLTVRFTDAGHLLGSASIEIWMTEGDVSKKIIFSGDIGNVDQPLINDPTYPEQADYVVMESTYGDRLHDRPADYAATLANVIQRTFDRGGNVVIPSFAVGRTQEMLYFIRQIKQNNMVHGYDGFEVYVDSPLAVEATNVFMKRMYDDFDPDAQALIKQGINPISFRGLRTAVTSDESKAINDDMHSKVIISASGMCDAGRIKHHLKHNLWRKDSTIVFVGYQAEGTIGRKLVDGEPDVKLFGEDIEVEAQICVLPGISGHADMNGLLRWVGSLKEKPAKVFVCHGEDQVTVGFADKLKNDLGLDSYAPFSGTVFNLATGQLEVEGVAKPIEHKSSIEEYEEYEADARAKLSAAGIKGFIPRSGRRLAGYASPTAKGSRDSGEQPSRRRPNGRFAAVYMDLVEAGQRLIAVIRENKGGANGDLKKFTEDINKLCEKWKR